jgi:hypothetical protein
LQNTLVADPPSVMKAQLRFRLAIVLVLLLPPIVLGRQKPMATIPNSANGFDKQYKTLFNAWEKADEPFKEYKRENEQKLMERFRGFAIPEHWFTDVFGPEQGPNFAKQYSELFRAFEFSTNREFLTVLGEDTAQVKTTELRTNQFNLLRSAQHPLVSLPPVQLFRVQHFTAPRSLWAGHSEAYTEVYTGRRYSFFYAEVFIYIDGAFRFVGSCDCPFWSPCSANDPVFNGQLVKPAIKRERKAM